MTMTGDEESEKVYGGCEGEPIEVQTIYFIRDSTQFKIEDRRNSK